MASSSSILKFTCVVLSVCLSLGFSSANRFFLNQPNLEHVVLPKPIEESNDEKHEVGKVYHLSMGVVYGGGNFMGYGIGSGSGGSSVGYGVGLGGNSGKGGSGIGYGIGSGSGGYGVGYGIGSSSGSGIGYGVGSGSGIGYGVGSSSGSSVGYGVGWGSRSGVGYDTESGSRGSNVGYGVFFLKVS